MTIAADQEIAPSYDRESTIIAMVTARAWRDPEYKARVLREPREVLAEEGLEFPPEIQVKAVVGTPEASLVQNTADLRYIVIPAQGETSEMTGAVDALRHRSDVRSATSAATLAVSVVSANTLSVIVTTVL